MNLDQVPSLWRNKAVELHIANSGELVKIHLIAKQARIVMKWVTPFKIHTPPVEDFGKYTTGECEISNAPTFCVVLD